MVERPADHDGEGLGAACAAIGGAALEAHEATRVRRPVAAAPRSGRLGVDAAVVPGARGAFEVFVDGRRDFSKLESGRFPTEEEILRVLGRPG